MARALWKGFVSFGLVAIPVSIISVEEKSDLHFHMLDSRDKSRIRYQRINANTGKEVPWDNIVKGYEIEKDNYVILNEEDFQKARPEAFKTIEIDEFVNLKEIDSLYFDKPYYLIPESKNKKAYVLLREALKKTNKVGVGKVIIHTKEYLSLIMPHQDALVLNLIRFQEEIRDEADLPFPSADLKTYHISPREIKMAMDLIDEMTTAWHPEKYHNDYNEVLRKWIEKKTQYHVTRTEKTPKKSDDVIDFVTLLKKSMEKKGKHTSSKKTSPAKKTAKK